MKVALVTGAGSGIGKAVSLGLARQGYYVVLAGRRAQTLEEVATAIAEHGGLSLAVTTDVTDPASVHALFERLRRELGRLDVLFNNAVTYMASLPLDTNVLSLTVMATKMPYVGRG